MFKCICMFAVAFTHKSHLFNLDSELGTTSQLFKGSTQRLKKNKNMMRQIQAGMNECRSDIQVDGAQRATSISEPLPKSLVGAMAVS